MNSLPALRRSVIASLRPSGAPWAVGPALWAIGTAALIAGTGVLVGQLQLVGIAVAGMLLGLPAAAVSIPTYAVPSPHPPPY
jgi:hypothetical protein